jgi:hypothetical protein
VRPSESSLHGTVSEGKAKAGGPFRDYLGKYFFLNLAAAEPTMTRRRATTQWPYRRR